METSHQEFESMIQDKITQLEGEIQNKFKPIWDRKYEPDSEEGLIARLGAIIK